MQSNNKQKQKKQQKKRYWNSKNLFRKEQCLPVPITPRTTACAESKQELKKHLSTAGSRHKLHPENYKVFSPCMSGKKSSQVPM
ncbi:MAG: hypothetical protein IKA32_00820, partial [Lentisphaeria bacterium]|nr:hypothetical protein [Lentisphaeria bacterium]